jgi:hypothetical protein
MATVAKNMIPMARGWRDTIRRGLGVALLVVSSAVMPWSAPVQAADEVRSSAHAAGLTALQVARDDDGLLLSAQLDFALPPMVREALTWGVPVYFIAGADIVHPRWYWSDQRLVRARRYWRLSYLPLTRRWRLVSSSEPLADDGIGTGLARHYDNLDDAVAALQNITGWRIADAGALAANGRQTLTFSFGIDTAQLPRALQIGLSGRSDWRLRIEQRIDMTQDMAP